MSAQSFPTIKQKLVQALQIHDREAAHKEYLKTMEMAPTVMSRREYIAEKLAYAHLLMDLYLKKPDANPETFEKVHQLWMMQTWKLFSAVSTDQQRAVQDQHNNDMLKLASKMMAYCVALKKTVIACDIWDTVMDGDIRQHYHTENGLARGLTIQEANSNLLMDTLHAEDVERAKKVFAAQLEIFKRINPAIAQKFEDGFNARQKAMQDALVAETV